MSKYIIPNKITLDDLKPLCDTLIDPNDETITEYVRKDITARIIMKMNRLNKGIEVIREKWPEATPLQLFIAFDLANCCTEDLLLKLDEPGFKAIVDNTLKNKLENKPTEFLKEEEEEDSEDEKDEEYVVEHFKHEKKTTERRVKCKVKISKQNKLELIPPAPKEISEETWKKWSDVRRRSYLSGMKDPNTFLYRNCPPGVERKVGAWSAEEKKLFMKRLKEIRGDNPTLEGKWGIFSLAIPGRVGYQCSNFYRQLIAQGEVTDSNYVFDENGKIHHRSFIHDGVKPKCEKHRLKPIDPKNIETIKFVLGEEKVKKSKKEPVHSSQNNETKVLSRYEKWALMNPIPNTLDSITDEVMKVPAMSEDGYVLDYNTWSELLSKKPINPFTGLTVQRRDLIILTTDNFDEYKSKIINIEF